jgi:hypothetical protein
MRGTAWYALYMLCMLSESSTYALYALFDIVGRWTDARDGLVCSIHAVYVLRMLYISYLYAMCMLFVCSV